MKAAEARKLIGKRVRYFIGTSLMARWGTVEEVKGKNIRIDGDWLWLPDLALTLE